MSTHLHRISLLSNFTFDSNRKKEPTQDAGDGLEHCVHPTRPNPQDQMNTGFSRSQRVSGNALYPMVSLVSSEFPTGNLDVLRPKIVGKKIGLFILKCPQESRKIRL